MEAVRFDRLPRDRAEISEPESLPLTKEDGLKIATAVFGTQWIKEHLDNRLEHEEISYRTVTRPGTHIDQYPGILFDPPLSLGELLSVSVTGRGEWGGIRDWREFPRVLRPVSAALPPAIVTGHRFGGRLSEPLMMEVATAIFGRDCIAKVPLMPDGMVMGTLEFCLVVEPGQPIDVDLDPPLARGEVIKVRLRAPRPGTQARMGVRGPKRPVNLPVATVQYPRVMLPLDEPALVKFIGEMREEWHWLEEASDGVTNRSEVHFSKDTGY
jgi:hypothetical protein